LGGIIMQRIVIETSSLYLEVSNFVVNEQDIIIVGTISNDTPLSYWLKISRNYEYTLEVTAKDTVNLWIPQNDITKVRYYEQN
jgi:hypothetical protein